MKVIVLKGSKLLSFILRKFFKIKKEKINLTLNFVILL